MSKTVASTDYIATLKKIKPFQGLPEADLQWVIDHSEYVEHKAGDKMFYVGMPVDHMQLVLSGSYRIQLHQGGELRDLGLFDAPAITGLLPFSRMVEAKADGIALTDVQILQLHKDYFVEMVNVSYPMVQQLVGAMSNRIREFTQNRLQSEKLMSLGKLSAGLAHELNNPASAIVRSVEELYTQQHKTPEQFKQVIMMKITPDETDKINELLFARLSNLGDFEDLSLIEQEGRKDDLIDWLEDHEVPEAEDLADTFVEFNLSEDDLDFFEETLDPEALVPVLRWAKSLLSTEKIVCEIKESSSRIADLVSSIKTYTHMDQADTAQAVDLHEGIKSTLIMLKHKIKSKQITFEKELDYNLPKVEIYPGELNQVWTNIIDNAVDAMSSGGVLKIRSYKRHDQAVVEITDSGHGIPEEVISQIFDPFFTTKGVGEGTGLGLEVTRRIIDKHRGTITVESEPGATTFTIALPIKQKSVSA